ncbi:MAG: bifunctional DNA-formamidopyrimidine glycosylase/DNA-(apurinic or apyrimidinic site) lyase [Roseiarcus sp.]|jgi:formamidopyrimidine-DNA glycosylase
MPELPEVETVRRGLGAVLVGKRFARVETRRADLRHPFPDRFVERLTGQRIEALTRRAKYLLAALEGGETLVMHLGMSGSFRVERDAETLAQALHFERSKSPAHDHVVFALDSGARVVYNDPRRFGSMILAPTRGLAEHPLFRDLGVEPLSEQFDARKLAALFAGARAPVKSALLDQRRIAGLGNIYVCEALHRARLSPLGEAGRLVDRKGAPTPAAEALVKAIRDVLEEAIAAGGSTLRDHRRTDGALGAFQHVFAVYDREGAPCPRPRCRGTIARIAQNGRSTFYCPACQK